jgi:hypothetical protein
MWGWLLDIWERHGVVEAPVVHTLGGDEWLPLTYEARSVPDFGPLEEGPADETVGMTLEELIGRDDEVGQLGWDEHLGYHMRYESWDGEAWHVVVGPTRGGHPFDVAVDSERP